MPIIKYSERFLLTLWVGGLWIIGYLVTPVLFKTLDNRQLAGELAGYFLNTSVLSVSSVASCC